MNELDTQQPYWDSVATKKTFTHPVQKEIFQKYVPMRGRILDYGCGYGRTCAELMKLGYSKVIGVDISTEMIHRGLTMHPELNLQHTDGGKLPYQNKIFSACTLFSVLTCIPSDEGQRHVIKELHRILHYYGILYISDYPLQQNARNIERYEKFKEEFGGYGVFRLSDGGVVRHHDMNWIYELLSDFEIIKEEMMEVSTMNGNEAEIFQIIARKC